MTVNEIRERVRRSKDPYVIVNHKPTGRLFVLDGAYRLMPNVSNEDALILWCMYVEEWDGWKPSIKSQMPEWAYDIDRSEFISRWIAK